MSGGSQSPRLSGILPIDKPQGWTSHDVVARVRRVAGQRQVGHAGTLDPLATGLLVLLLGNATRLSPYVMNSPKIYRAEVVLGVQTNTDDAEGEIVLRGLGTDLPRARIEKCLASYSGTISQVPPAYAAIRQAGTKLYLLARQGVTVEAAPRDVVIHGIRILYWRPPRLGLLIHCGPGTYIRSIARDLGTDLGVGGYLHALRRVSSGSFTVSQAQKLADLSGERLVEVMEPPDRALVDWPVAVLTEQEMRRALNGQAVALGTTATGNVRLYGPSGRFLGLGACTGEDVKPFRILSHG